MRAIEAPGPPAQLSSALLFDDSQFGLGLDRSSLLTLKICKNTGADLRDRDWPAEEESLGLIAVGLVEKRRLCSAAKVVGNTANANRAQRSKLNTNCFVVMPIVKRLRGTLAPRLERLEIGRHNRRGAEVVHHGLVRLNAGS